MTILVTGAAGFIGHHLCQSLTKDGHSVIGIDNFDPFYSRSIKEKNIKEIQGDFTFKELDLINQDDLLTTFEKNKIEIVYHLAAKAGVRPSLENPQSYIDSNVKGTVNLLEAMKTSGCKKLVFASSSSVYGKSPDIPFKIDNPLDQIVSVYAATKKSGETFTKTYHQIYDIDCINLRFFTVYGPGQRPDLAIHKFMKNILLGEKITMFGDGTMARDYTYIDDIVTGVRSAGSRVLKSTSLYETYNLGNSSPVNLSELITAIEGVIGKKANIEKKPVPLGDVPITFADVSLTEKNLGYRPNTELKDGLTRMAKWLKPLYS